jgi:hypothetical protein
VDELLSLVWWPWNVLYPIPPKRFHRKEETKTCLLFLGYAYSRTMKPVGTDLSSVSPLCRHGVGACEPSESDREDDNETLFFENIKIRTECQQGFEMERVMIMMMMTQLLLLL